MVYLAQPDVRIQLIWDIYTDCRPSYPVVL